MKSRWQANKIGLMNFWYYDEQEFVFTKGRMLLRGSNGSGKSVTMQSVIPLLLDGNMSPERLDPFGSRDRKMNTYLLEEGDDREERIGYLYLEFQREESNTFFTIGMGMRARKGKPMDKWYFSLNDGRRVGHEFLLYKNEGEKLPLTKKELSNRVGMGGQVFDRQSDYMEYVNRHIFGFDTIEEYKEMIDLLIQLRTPKLSKDFKPTVVSEILSDSLQPLSDEELRPMSEAIENMDTLNLNLKAKQESEVAAKKIQRVLDRYNRLFLWEKATNYANNHDEIKKCKDELSNLEKEQEFCQAQIEALAQEEIDLDAKRKAYEQEKEVFQKSDAWNLKNEENKTKQGIEETEESLKGKEIQGEHKREQKVALQYKEKEEIEKKELKEVEIQNLLEEMKDSAQEMEFQEHEFMSDELQEKMEEAYGFTAHEEQVTVLKEQIKQGVDYLKESEFLQKSVEENLRKRDKSQMEVDRLERKRHETEDLFITAQGEWKEALYIWKDESREFNISDKEFQAMSVAIEQYDLQSDYRTLCQPIQDAYHLGQSKIELELQQEKVEEKRKREEKQALEQELEEWKNFKELVPERSESVITSRLKLEEIGIPYQEFYKLLEFGNQLTEEECNHLEETLLEMGILDAVVVDDSYKKQILELDHDGCDRYLFMQNGGADHSLLDILEFNENLSDIFLNMKLTNVLKSIGMEMHGYEESEGNTGTKIWKNGVYQIGAVTGTITGNHKASFLGTKAREENRKRKIAECEEAIKGLDDCLVEIEARIQTILDRKELIKREYETFPKDDDLIIALKMLDEVLRSQKQFKNEVEHYEEELQVVTKQKNEVTALAMEIASKIYLTCSLKVFENATSAMETYEKQFFTLKMEHQQFVQSIINLETIRERLEAIEEDEDQILFEIGKLKRELRRLEEQYDSIQIQLKSEGFEEQQKRMEDCVIWLEEYPRVLTKCIAQKSDSENKLVQFQNEHKRKTNALEILLEKEQYLLQAYEKELDLDYVELAEEIRKQAKAVSQYLDSECKTMSKSNESLSLNRVIFENQMYLTDYQVTMMDIFSEMDEEKKEGYPEVSRIEVMARYQGVKVQFSNLMKHLEEEIEELKVLIRDGDRELFEDILSNTISRKLRGKINGSNAWVEKMNSLMNSMNTSSGLRLSLKWRYKTAENEQQLDTRELVEYLKKDYRMLREDEAEKLSKHFRSKVEEARRNTRDSKGSISFYQVMKDTLDYRKWFEFQLFSEKAGERMKELTNSVFGTFSGGEKAMAMYVPLFSAVVAKYQGGHEDAPRLISLDEAFAGVDNKNIRDMFRLMTEFQFEFIINSQVLWGDVDTLDALSIYQLLRPINAKFVTVMPFVWNGKKREMLEDEQSMQKRADELSGRRVPQLH